MIKGENLKFRYNEKKAPVLDNVSIEVREGYMTVLLGHNAGGKSTLFKLLYGALLPESGSVYYGFSEDDNYSEAFECRLTELNFDNTVEMRRKVAMVSEELPLFATLDVAQNIEMFESLYPEFDREEFEKTANDFGLFSENKEMFYKNLPTDISTGEYMKLKLALTFARHPKLLIMDEPFANLDPVVKTDIMELMQERIAKENIGILLSTHLLEEINDAADYIYVIEKGKIVKSGDRESLFEGEGVDELRKLL